MLKEIFGDLSDMLGDFKPGPAKRTITVAKPYCTPARDIVMTALQPYGVKIYGYKERMITTSPKNWLRQQRVAPELLESGFTENALPLSTMAKVTVSEKQATWAEYLMLRTGKLYVPGAYVNKCNADWAARHNGQMPPAWKDSKPWIEKSCSEGKAAWGPVRKAMKEQKARGKRL